MVCFKIVMFLSEVFVQGFVSRGLEGSESVVSESDLNSGGGLSDIDLFGAVSRGRILGQTLHLLCPHVDILGCGWKLVIPGGRVEVFCGGSPGVIAFTRCWAMVLFFR